MEKEKIEERYSRQILFRGIGEEGQRRLAAGRVAIVGCGATGSALASLLARAGVGMLRIIDRDDVVPGNIHALLEGMDVILDGTDNFETRYLVNDFAVEASRPWIYSAAVGSYGVTLNILPGKTACLSCIFPDSPRGMVETCETSGILNTAVNVVASVAASEAMKMLVGGEALGK